MELDDRKKRILEAVVENYIESAEPVASKTIADKCEKEFSSATIRNEMKLLEEIGLLEQPHVSAGRVPSTKGYRYYVDNLMKNDVLTMVDIDYINNNIVSYGSTEATLENAMNVVSKILKLPTVLHLDRPDVVENIKILKISEQILLIVLMSKSGTVKDVIVKITDSIPVEKIEELDRLMNENLRGTPLENLPNILSEAINNQLEKFSGILKEVIRKMNYELTGEKENIVRTDVSTLLDVPEFTDVNKVKEFLNVLNTKQIMDMAMEKVSSGDVSIVIGSEHKDILLKDYSIISLDLETDKMPAKVAVLGPKRTDYSKAMATLKQVNNKLKEIFGSKK